MKCRNNCNLNIYKGLNKDRNDDNSVLEHSQIFVEPYRKEMKAIIHKVGDDYDQQPLDPCKFIF
jgi:hypothetical protein